MNIIETIGSWGVQSAENATKRMRTPKPGDLILFESNKYPYKKGMYGRVDNINGFCNNGETHICCELGSVFLYEDGHVSISGGPFNVVKITDLIPTFRLENAQFWNWGDNSPGAGKGVHYTIARPVFKLECHCLDTDTINPV